MPQSLEGYVALMTGGTTGLGLWRARRARRRGAKVAVTDFEQENLDRRQRIATRGDERL